MFWCSVQTSALPVRAAATLTGDGANIQEEMLWLEAGLPSRQRSDWAVSARTGQHWRTWWPGPNLAFTNQDKQRQQATKILSGTGEARNVSTRKKKEEKKQAAVLPISLRTKPSSPEFMAEQKNVAQQVKVVQIIAFNLSLIAMVGILGHPFQILDINLQRVFKHEPVRRGADKAFLSSQPSTFA